MVSLAAAAPRPLPPTSHRTDGSNASNLRHSAIWYPDVPPPSLDLNEQFLVTPDAYTRGFKPLFWSRFGGPGGKYLPLLQKITIRRASGCMDFSFVATADVIPDGCRSFGRVADLADDDEEQGAVEFPIDGPGGEVVNRVEIGQVVREDGTGWWGGNLGWLKVRELRLLACMRKYAYPMDQFGVLYAWHECILRTEQLSTNHGRTCEVGSKRVFRRHVIVGRELSAAPGTAITAFYGAQVRGFRIPWAIDH